MSPQKVALITGGNKGIGLETARGLGKMGITVLIGCRDVLKGEAAVKELQKDGVKDVRVVKLDVTSEADQKAVAETIAKDFGKLDILVNNAGIALDDGDFGNSNGFNTTTTVSLDTLRKTFETNLFSVVSLTQKLLPLIEKAPSGRIVNLSSILASLQLHGDPTSPIYSVKGFAYDASKTALNAFTVHLAAALKKTKIKVNSAHPGWVKTDMGGPNAMMEVSEGGKTSVQLATLGEDGPTGGYFHMGQPLPW